MRMMLLGAVGLIGFSVAISGSAWSATPEQYLKDAQGALQANAPHRALADLDRAEAIVLDRGTPGRSVALRELATARVAIVRGEWLQASDYMGEAMQHRSASATGGGVVGSGFPFRFPAAAAAATARLSHRFPRSLIS
jgi:hypothetical protein